MDKLSVSEIAGEWLRKWASPSPASVGPGSAGESVLDWELPREYPELCWSCILYIFGELGPNTGDPRFAVLAAGPFEDLMAHHGPTLIDRVELMAKKDVVFATLLGGVWRSDIETNVWERMQKVAKVGW